MAVLRAWNNDPQLKEKYVADMTQDAESHRLQSGDWWNQEKQRGCLLGCFFRQNCNPAKAMEDTVGFPAAFSNMMEHIFEGLPQEDKDTFAVTVLQKIPEGADLTRTLDKITHWIMEDLLTLPTLPDDVRGTLEIIKLLYRRRINGGKPQSDEPRQAYRESLPSAVFAADAAYGSIVVFGASHGIYGAAASAFGAEYGASAQPQFWQRLRDALYSFLG